VAGRDDLRISRLPSAAEPTPTTIPTICQIDIIDTTTVVDYEILPDASIDITPVQHNEFDENFDNFQLINTIVDNNQESDHDYETDEDLQTILSPVQLPDFTQYQPIQQHDESTLSINVLSALDEKLTELGLTRSEFYTQFRADEHSNTKQKSIRAHFDGGSMATTTDQLHCLWFYHRFTNDETPQQLQVADNHQHCPEGIGFLRIPTQNLDSCYVRCLYTPSLPATIVSPYDVGVQYGCCGYSCTSSFDGINCIVCLHYPSEDTSN
jgi:hypothetical protein